MKVELERAVMPKYGNSAPGPPINELFRKFLIFMERFLNYASNEPSATPDIKFKSSYARKRDFGYYAQI